MAMIAQPPFPIPHSPFPIVLCGKELYYHGELWEMREYGVVQVLSPKFDTDNW